MLLQPQRLVCALHEALDLIGLACESAGVLAGDDRWRRVGEQIRRAARELAPP